LETARPRALLSRPAPGCPVFRARFPNGGLIIGLLRAVSIISDDACFKIDSKGMSLRAMDPARVAMVDFKLYSSAAEEWVADGELKMDVSLSELLRAVGRIGGEPITLTYDPEKKIIQITLANASRERRVYVKALSEVEGEGVEVGEDFAAGAMVEAKTLHDAIEDCRIINGQRLRLSIAPDSITLSAEGEMGRARITLPKAGAAIYSINADREYSALYPTAYLSRIVKAGMAASNTASIGLSENGPLKVGFDFISGRLDYYLAPQIA